jgi:hypothetical protein
MEKAAALISVTDPYVHTSIAKVAEEAIEIICFG